MFKKFKDKLAEEVKSSPQRIQQFAQAAQAAVTSASSSISDITNNDLFSIGDSDSSKTQLPGSQTNTIQNINQIRQSTPDLPEFPMDFEDRQRHRRLSNSSFASDISFRLPNYESPSMYHLQSDMDVSASEAEEKGFISGNVNLDRVTKEQLYAAYRRTQDRCKKYKTQYSDLARHYKLLERENAKARNVLVETQDKALRRISELKEQCSLEQSAKAHLEKALRIELEEKSMKINALSTQLNLLQSDNNLSAQKDPENSQVQLINLNDANDAKEKDVSQISDNSILNNKMEKLEQLLSKYKESLKASKEKNSVLTAEVQKLNLDLDVKKKENHELQLNIEKAAESKEQIHELLEKIESLENLNNTLEFSKSKELSILESNLQSSQEEILQLQEKIKHLSKREEDYAISLAENKLSIHKELESKEAEIKSLKESLTNSHGEIKTLNKTVKDQQNEILKLEGECLKLNNDLRHFAETKTKFDELAKEYENLNEKRKVLENIKVKSEEEINCLHLQLRQETAEKLSVIDRNVYLEGRNSQVTEENTKKRSQINKLEHEVVVLKKELDDLKMSLSEREQTEVESSILRLTEEASAWKLKCSSLESEIQEERVELVKLQAEIEKLLSNHESLQKNNIELHGTLEKLTNENVNLSKELVKYESISTNLKDLKKGLTDIRDIIILMSSETKSLNGHVMDQWIPEFKEKIMRYNSLYQQEIQDLQQTNISLKEQIVKLNNEYEILNKNKNSLNDENITLNQTLKDKDAECVALSQKIQNITTDNEISISKLKNQCNTLEKENKELLNKIELLDRHIISLKEELNTSHDLHNSTTEKLDNLMKENKEIIEMKKEQSENAKYITELESNLNIVKQQNTELMSFKIEMEIKYNALDSELNDLRIIYSKTESEFHALKQEYENVNLAREDIKSKYMQVESQLNELRKTFDTMKNDQESLKQNNSDLLFSKKELEIKYKEMETELNELRNIHVNFESRLHTINQENTVLKSSHAEIDKSLKLAESDFKELRKTYNQIENEKAELEHTINELKNNISSQNEVIQDQKNIISLNNKVCDCDNLKEDNRRLHSDIEGLQTYLSKISKENSDLNDKLRELFVSGDSNSEGNDELKTEIQVGKDKIEELLRENSVLIEENLELKDQIQSQLNSTQALPLNAKTTNNDNLNEKYEHLLETKKHLELKVDELEQMNTSLNKNMDQNQNNYERLKLSNEKLQIKLDEALVSLRHLHALEENTELEYLRNILYEYLTGSGTHSVTLAKVLAAVVKFDDRQTEQILLKEKERQGFLHQLGII